MNSGSPSFLAHVLQGRLVRLLQNHSVHEGLVALAGRHRVKAVLCFLRVITMRGQLNLGERALGRMTLD